MYRPWDLKISSFLPYLGSWIQQSGAPCEARRGSSYIMLRDFLSSIEKNWANEEGMKHDLYFIHVKNVKYARAMEEENPWIDAKLFI